LVCVVWVCGKSLPFVAIVLPGTRGLPKINFLQHVGGLVVQAVFGIWWCFWLELYAQLAASVTLNLHSPGRMYILIRSSFIGVVFVFAKRQM